MPFVLPSDPSDGQVAPASWGDAVRDALNFLANPPAAQAYMSAAQTINDAAITTLLYNSEVFDTDTMHSTAVNTNRLTFTSAGLYLIGVQAFFSADADYELAAVGIRNSGGVTMAQANDSGTDINTDMAVGITRLQKMTAGDWVDTWCYQDNVSGNTNTCNAVFWAVRLGEG